jgi:hypothetical protein
MRGTATVEKRIPWADLPGPLKAAIEKRTGPITAGRAVTAGQNSPLAAIIDARDGKTFVKGLPADHPRVITQEREAAAASLVSRISPALLWHFDEAGWNVLGFEHVSGRAADYSPRSPDLDLVVSLIEELGRVRVPADPGPLKRAEDRWKSYTDDPADALALAGGSPAHTDWMPDNVLIADGRAWLVDWAWPTLAAAWVDPASWALRIMARGHTAAESEAHAARLSAYATADPAHIDIFVRANVRMWNEIEETNGRPWAKIMARTARAWAQHRTIRVLSKRSPPPPWGHAVRCDRLRALAALSRADRRFAALWMSTARSCGASLRSGSTSRLSRSQIAWRATYAWSSRAMCLDQRAWAAFCARSRRCSGVIRRR